MEFALSNTCNLQCVQCNGELSSAIRAQREGRPPLRSPYGDAFFEELVEFLPHVEVAVFIGGEPFLSRECRRVWDLLIELDLRPEVHVTTNATVWDERVEHYLRALEMNVAVSIDGATAAVNDAIRVGSTHADVLTNRERIRATIRSYGGSLGINYCLMVQNWSELLEVLLDGDRIEADVNVLPVIHPPAMSLASLVPSELQAVVDSLDERVATLDLQRNLPVWEGVRAHLGSLLVVPSTPIDPPGRVGGGRDDSLLREVEDELERWSDEPPLVFDVERGVVRSVRGGGSWCGRLQPESWPGHPAPVLLDELRQLGAVEGLEQEASPTLRRGWCTVRSGDRAWPHRIAVVEWHEGPVRWSRTVVARGGPPSVSADR